MPRARGDRTLRQRPVKRLADDGGDTLPFTPGRIGYRFLLSVIESDGDSRSHAVTVYYRRLTLRGQHGGQQFDEAWAGRMVGLGANRAWDRRNRVLRL